MRLALGEPATRVASEFLKVNADIEYTFLITGDIAAPTISLWEIPVREFDGTGTVFEMRVGHGADVLGSVDVYVGLLGIAPVLGEQVATLAPGEVSTPMDLSEDDYLITVTAPGDPTTVLYESFPSLIVAQSIGDHYDF